MRELVSRSELFLLKKELLSLAPWRVGVALAAERRVGCIENTTRRQILGGRREGKAARFPLGLEVEGGKINFDERQPQSQRPSEGRPETPWGSRRGQKERQRPQRERQQGLLHRYRPS